MSFFGGFFAAWRALLATTGALAGCLSFVVVGGLAVFGLLLLALGL